MFEDVGQFKIAMHDFIFDEGLEGMQNLDEVLDSLIFGEFLLVLEVCAQIALIAVLEDQVDVVGGLLDVEELDDVVIPA